MSAARWSEGRAFLRRVWFAPVIAAFASLFIWAFVAAAVSIAGFTNGGTSSGVVGSVGVTDLTTAEAPRCVDPVQTHSDRAGEFQYTTVYNQISEKAYVFGYTASAERYAMDIPAFATGSVLDADRGTRVAWAVSQDEVAAYYDAYLRERKLIPADAELTMDAATLAKPFQSTRVLAQPAVAVWTVRRTSWSPMIVTANLVIPPVLGGGITLLVVLIGALVVAMTREPGHCFLCGYDRAGLAKHVQCPECGSYPIGYVPARGRETPSA